MADRLARVAATALVAAIGVTIVALRTRPAGSVRMYALRFDLTPTEVAPTELAAIARSRFPELSPVPAADPIEKPGQVLMLRFAGFAPMPVVVCEISDTGWAFGTLPGHPAHPARIRFAFDSDGERGWLAVTATGERRRFRSTGSEDPAERILTAAARALWAEFAAAITASL